MSITNGYCTLGEALETIQGSGSHVASQDAYVEACIEVASRSVDDWCQRRFYKDAQASTRTYAPTGTTYVEIDDASAAPTVVATDNADDLAYSTAWLATDYVLEPANALGPDGSTWPYSGLRAVGGRHFPRWGTNPRPIRVTAVWGWADVPPEVSMATRLLTNQIFASRNAPFGAAGIADIGIIRIRQSTMVADLLMGLRRNSVLVA